MSQTADAVRVLVEPLVLERGATIYDVDFVGGALQVLVNRDGGIDLDALAELTKAISHLLDETDPIDGHYTLEVSSPGLERPLRLPEHFQAAVDEQITVKTVPTDTLPRRVAGRLVAATDDGFDVQPDGADDAIHLRYDDVQKARTVFVWATTPKPGKQKARSTRSAK